MKIFSKKSFTPHFSGFTLIETLIVIAIIGILATVIIIALVGARDKAKDAKRKSEISQIGKLLVGLGCYLPDDGPGEYDLVLLSQELRAKYPEYSKFVSTIPKDPKTGTETESKYIYIVNADKKCAVYANLENPDEPVTLTITTPTPGGGTGVLEAEEPGWNNTPLYFQYSK